MDADIKDISIESFRMHIKEYDNIYYELSKSCGISEAEFWILFMICDGVTKQSEISEQLFISKQTVNSACMKLIERGFVRLDAVENNLRTKQLCLTEAGIAFAEVNIRCLSKAEEWAWQELTHEERSILDGLTERFNNLMKQKLTDIFGGYKVPLKKVSCRKFMRS